jgi:hypothetical protein
MPFSDARNERDRADTGRNSGNHGGGNAGAAGDRNRAAMFGGGFGSGARGTLGQQQDRRNMETARRSGNAAPGVGANNNRGTLSQMQDRINTNRALARSNTAPGVGNYSKAMDDYNNLGQGFLDDPLGAIGRFFGSGFGVGEIDPSTQAPKSFLGRSTASWGIDPIGAAIGLGSNFMGPAGSLLGAGYRGLKSLSGWQGPMIAFDGNQPVTGGFPSMGGPGSPTSPQSGGGTGNGGQMASIGQPAGVQPVRPAGTPGAASPQMAWNSMQPAMLGGPVPGLQNYSVNTPGYNFLGSVGAPQQQQAAMFGRGVPRRG